MSLAAVYLLGTQGAADRRFTHCDPRSEDVASQDQLTLVEAELACEMDGSPFPAPLEDMFQEELSRKRAQRIRSWLRLWGAAQSVCAISFLMMPVSWATPLNTATVVGMGVLPLLAFPASLLTRLRWLLMAVFILGPATVLLQTTLMLIPLWDPSAVAPGSLLAPLATLAMTIGAPFPKRWTRASATSLVLVLATGAVVTLPLGRAIAVIGVATVLRLISEHVIHELSALRREGFLLRLRGQLLQTQRVAELASLERLAKIDSLTGIANRRAFDTCLADHLVRAQIAHPLCVALLDVDYFKSLNDTAGHLSGDECLRRIATSLRKAADNAFVARYGGEEFAVLFHTDDGEDPRPRLEALRLAVLALDISHPGRLGEVVTISVGGTLSITSENSRVVLDRADHALYRAKAAGRNRVEFEDASMRLAPTAQDLRRLHDEAVGSSAPPSDSDEPPCSDELLQRA